MARPPLLKGDQPLSTVRAFFLTPWIRELEKAGKDVDGFLTEHRLHGVRLSTLYEEIPLRECIGFTETLSETLERNFLGLELANEFRVTDLGPAYIVIALAKNLRTALSSLARCQASWQTDTVLDLVQHTDTTGFRYAIQDPAVWPRRQDAEFVLGTIARIVRERAGPHWRPERIEFEHDVSGRAERLSRWFGGPVVGNRAANAIYIANEDMDRPLRQFAIQEDDILPLVERHLVELMTPPRKPLPTWAAKADFLIGRKLGRAEVKIEDIAAELHTSPRSLRRHLAEEGTSFRALLRERRESTVKAILQSESTKLKELAYRLNYSDSATLSRAYKNWTGSSPSSLRFRQNKNPDEE
jgi:AraC-like DNA-binding protein